MIYGRKPTLKISIWTKIFWLFVVILFSTVIAIQLSGYTYIYKTLIYRYPDIDDLNIFYSQRIDEGNRAGWPVSTEYNKQKLTDSCAAELGRDESVAFLVIKDDSIRYEQYWDKYDSLSTANSFSVAKSIVSLLVGIAQHDGKLALDDAVGKYIPSYSKAPKSQISIRHLLNMSSGLNWDEAYSNLFSKTTEAYYGTDLQKLVEQLKVAEPPGVHYNYMSCNTVLLALVLEKATGVELSEYASQKLWKPLGCTSPAYWSLDHNQGLEKAYCCFYSTARDFARIGQLMCDSGKWNGRELIPADYYREITQPVLLNDEDSLPVKYYGLHWWLLRHRDRDFVYARGLKGEYIVVDPADKIVMVRLGKKRGTRLPDHHYSDMMKYLDGVLDTWAPAQHPSNP